MNCRANFSRMKKEEITVLDLERILIGEAPWGFLLEILVRAIIVYVILLVVLRMMGKRVSAQLSISELAVIVSLGAAIGVPMQSPERGMLPAVIILAVAYVIQKGIALFSFKDRKIELLTQGEVSPLVHDGTLLLDQMENVQLSRERIFSVLRGYEIEHLGQVKRLYIEACGTFSIYKYKKPKPGLSILPLFDDEIRKRTKEAEGNYACSSCGNVIESNTEPDEKCKRCESDKWREAVIDSGGQEED